jgi:hypothetical protein
VNRVVFVIGAIVTALSIVFVGGGAEAKLNDANVSDDMLRTMALRQSDLGAEYASLERNEDANFETNAYLIEHTEGAGDKQRVAASIEKSGRINGHSQNFLSFDALFNAKGAVMVCTGADLYKDAAGAAFMLKDYREINKKEAYKPSDKGSLQAYNDFDVSVGEDSWGVTMRVLVPAKEWGTKSDIEVTSTQRLWRSGEDACWAALSLSVPTRRTCAKRRLLSPNNSTGASRAWSRATCRSSRRRRA